MSYRYFDYAASRPCTPAALAAYTDVAARHYGNPSSAHEPGREARRRFEADKRKLCELCGFADGRLVVTSGGTEANNLVIQGHLNRFRRSRLLVAADVHPSIWFATQRYAKRCDVLPLGPGGVIDVQTLKRAIGRRTSLVAVSHACNETGLIHPVREIAELCRRRGVSLLIDGAQAVGHLDLDLSDLSCDYYTFSAHKFGGTTGIGGVLLRSSDLEPLHEGGGQEFRLRSGTEHVAGLAAAAVALASASASLDAEQQRLRKLTQFLCHFVAAQCAWVVVNSDLEAGLPGLLSLSMDGLEAQQAVAELDIEGFAVATGSACHASDVLPSRAILALGRSETQALGTLRISMGEHTTEHDVYELGTALVALLQRQGTKVERG